MNNLFTRSWQVHGGSFTELKKDQKKQDIEMGRGTAPGMDLQQFTRNVQAIEADIKATKNAVLRLEETHEKTKSLTKASEVQGLRTQMAKDAEYIRSMALKVKENIQALHRENEDNRKYPDCGLDTTTDRRRTTPTASLGKKLRDVVETFKSLKIRMDSEHRELVERRVFTVTGQKADIDTIDELIETGKSEEIFQRAVRQQGRGKALEVLGEMQERHEQAKELTKSVVEVNQIFLDMASLVEAQGEVLDNIEHHLGKAVEHQQRGNQHIGKAGKTKQNTSKWTCYAVIIIIAIVAVLLIILLPTILSLIKIN